MAVAWPDVRAALAQLLPAALPAGYKFSNGPILGSTAPAGYLTLGHAPSTDDDSAGTFVQTNGPDGYVVTESGFITGELSAVSGSARLPSVFAAFDALTAVIQKDMTLGGVLASGSTVTAEATVIEAQSKSGAVQRLIITVQYLTNI